MIQNEENNKSFTDPLNAHLQWWTEDFEPKFEIDP